MKDEITVRPAIPADFPDVHVLYKALVGTIDVPDGEVGQARFSEILKHPGTTVFVAEHRGRAVAAVTLHVLPNLTFGARPYGLIENVVTLAAFQGRGVGRAVMNHAVEAAWRAGAYKIMLLTGKDLGARPFYEKIGFTADEKFGMTLRRAPKRRPL